MRYEDSMKGVADQIIKEQQRPHTSHNNIHILHPEKCGKIELFTKLSTLSTFFEENRGFLKRGEQNRCFVIY